MKQTSHIHYWALKRFSFRFSFYAFIDTKEYLADALFIRERVRVWFGDEYITPDSPYRVIFCKCKKKDAQAFERALEALPDKMLLCGHQDYIAYCEKLMRTIEQSHHAGGDFDNEAVRPIA